MSEYTTTHRRPIEPEKPTRVFIPALALGEITLRGSSVDVDLRDAIIVVQNAGYLVYEIGELPEVTLVNGKPKLPSVWGEGPANGNEATRFYEEAFGKLALARWWEQEGERKEARKAVLLKDMADAKGFDTAIADLLIERGWRRG